MTHNVNRTLIGPLSERPDPSREVLLWIDEATGLQSVADGTQWVDVGGGGGGYPGVTADGNTPPGVYVLGEVAVTPDHGNTGVITDPSGSIQFYASQASTNPIGVQLASGAFSDAIAVSDNVFNPLFSVSATGAIHSAASIGVFGHTPPAAQAVLATGAGHTVDDVIALLQSYGLCKQS